MDYLSLAFQLFCCCLFSSACKHRDETTCMMCICPADIQMLSSVLPAHLLWLVSFELFCVSIFIYISFSTSLLSCVSLFHHCAPYLFHLMSGTFKSKEESGLDCRSISQTNIKCHGNSGNKQPRVSGYIWDFYAPHHFNDIWMPVLCPLMGVWCPSYRGAVVVVVVLCVAHLTSMPQSGPITELECSWKSPGFDRIITFLHSCLGTGAQLC